MTYLKRPSKSYSAALLPDGTTVTGNSTASLRKAVWQHCVETDQVPPNFEAAFQEYVCAALPEDRREQECSCDEANAPDEVRRERVINIADVWRFLKTAGAWISSGRIVSQEEANRRAAICAGCPYNGEVLGCSVCSGIIGKVAEVVGGLKTESDAALRACVLCGCSLRAKAWVPLEAIPEDGIEYPEWCWQRRE